MCDLCVRACVRACVVHKQGAKLVNLINLACDVVGPEEKVTGGGEGDSTSDGTNGDAAHAHASPPAEEGVSSLVARTAMDVKEFLKQQQEAATPEAGRIKEAKAVIIAHQMNNLQHLTKEQSKGVAQPPNLVKSAEVRA